NRRQGTRGLRRQDGFESCGASLSDNRAAGKTKAGSFAAAGQPVRSDDRTAALKSARWGFRAGNLLLRFDGGEHGFEGVEPGRTKRNELLHRALVARRARAPLGGEPPAF